MRTQGMPTPADCRPQLYVPRAARERKNIVSAEAGSSVLLNKWRGL